jgi:hypothetical protein
MSDVHGARTAVAPVSKAVLDELRAAKASSFANEAPTVPKDGPRILTPPMDDASPERTPDPLLAIMALHFRRAPNPLMALVLAVAAAVAKLIGRA